MVSAIQFTIEKLKFRSDSLFVCLFVCLFARVGAVNLNKFISVKFFCFIVATYEGILCESHSMIFFGFCCSIHSGKVRVQVACNDGSKVFFKLQTWHKILHRTNNIGEFN